MLCCVPLQRCIVDVCVGALLLFLAGLQQVEAAAAAADTMASLNWKPFIYGGMASIVAEFGTFVHHGHRYLRQHFNCTDPILCAVFL